MTRPEDVASDCAALRTRMVARSVTRAYDKALRPVDLKITQFTLLVAIDRQTPGSISRLAEVLAMERTTLTRNLQLLEKRGLIVVGPEGYRRARSMALTPAGEALLRRSLPLWQQAQDALVGRIGPDRWPMTKEILHSLVRMA